MSKTDETFIAAFPFAFTDSSESEWDGQQFADMGMSLRDYFAGQALANLNLQAHVKKPAAEHLAASAYEIADAMLKERDK